MRERLAELTLACNLLAGLLVVLICWPPNADNVQERIDSVWSIKTVWQTGGLLKPSISVIIAFRNARAHLDRCLEASQVRVTKTMS